MLSRVQLLATPWTAAHQAPLSMGFSRQHYWSGVPVPPPYIATAGTYNTLKEFRRLSIITCMRNCQSLFESDCTISYSCQQSISVPGVTHAHQRLGTVSLFNVTKYKGCETAYYYGFNVHFPDDYWLHTEEQGESKTNNQNFMMETKQRSNIFKVLNIFVSEYLSMCSLAICTCTFVKFVFKTLAHFLSF